MSHVHLYRSRLALLLGATTLALLIPRHANAQFNVNSLAGKTHGQVVKILGQPIVASGSPLVDYARFKSPGAVDTIVWYKEDSGLVFKVQVLIRAKQGETYPQILKRYHLDLGPSPASYNLAKPNLSLHNSGPVPGSPWRSILVGYLYAVPFQYSLVKYCKDNGLDPNTTYFWTIQVQNGGTATNAISQGAGDTGAAPKHKGGGRRKKK